MITITRTYEINVQYCNDITLSHSHLTARDATAEYAQMISEAIEPTMGHPEAKHVRRVTMVIKDEDAPTRFIDSGVFPCEDRPNE